MADASQVCSADEEVWTGGANPVGVTYMTLPHTGRERQTTHRDKGDRNTRKRGSRLLILTVPQTPTALGKPSTMVSIIVLPATCDQGWPGMGKGLRSPTRA